MLSNEVIEKGFIEENRIFMCNDEAYSYGARFGYLKALEEVRLTVGMYNSDMSATMQNIDRLIAEAKEGK